MNKKFKNKYRIKSARAWWWDYGSNAAYFVTICSKNRFHFFGDAADGKMHLSKIGKIANDCWLAIPQHFPFVRLGEFVVMPNHVHGIVIIDKDVETQEAPPVETQEAPPVETQDLASLPEDSQKNKFGPQSRNLASIIRGFKIGVTKSARSILPAFAWQPRYHDHIIRDTKSYDRISNYIINNPASWKEDKFY